MIKILRPRDMYLQYSRVLAAFVRQQRNRITQIFSIAVVVLGLLSVIGGFGYIWVEQERENIRQEIIVELAAEDVLLARLLSQSSEDWTVLR